MSNQLLEAAQAVVQAARKHGATQARAIVSRARESKVEWRDGKLDRLRESTRMNASVALFVDGRYSSNGTSDMRPEALDRFVAEAVAMTRVLRPDPHRKLPPKERCSGRFEGDLALLDEPGLNAVDASGQRKVAARLEEAMRAAPGADAILSATGTAGQTHTQVAAVDSQGLEATEETSVFLRVAMTTVRGKGDRKPVGYDYAVTRRRSDLPSVDALGRKASQRALACVGEAPLKSGKYACVIENMRVGRLLDGVLSPLRGNPLQQKRSFLLDKMGARIGSAVFDITDDPLLPGGLSSTTWDGEGMSTQRRKIFDKGKLRTYYLDTYYASKLDKPPTTSGWTNLVFGKGRRDLDGLLRAMRRGILITGFSGGNSNAATGDFSIGIRGHWVEGGRIVRPVAEMNLAGNHLELWQKLVEVGADPFEYDGIRAPSLRFDALQFSGT